MSAITRRRKAASSAAIRSARRANSTSTAMPATTQSTVSIRAGSTVCPIPTTNPAADNQYTNNLSWRGAGIKQAEQFYSFEIGFVPGLNAVQGLHGAITGCDAITGQNLNGWQRALGALAAAGPILHGAAGIIGAGGELLGDISGSAAREARYTRFGFDPESAEKLASQAVEQKPIPTSAYTAFPVIRNAAKPGPSATGRR